MAFPATQGLAVVSLMKPTRYGNTTASAVIDREDYDNPASVLFVLHVGASMVTAASGMDIFTFHSDTVSGTASGQTAITSGNTSGADITASGQTIGLQIDLRDKGRFIGCKLCMPTASAGAAVLGILSDGQTIPPAAAKDGFTVIRRIGF